jgi:Methyl-accepting chemotaxis protein
MSFKSKIYAIVALLIFLAVFIGGVGIFAMTRINHSIENAIHYTNNVSDLKDLKSEMQDVLINVREMVLAPTAEMATEEKASIDQSVGVINSALDRIQVSPQSSSLWASLQNEWAKHQEIVGRIYANTVAGNQDVAFRVLTEECNPTRVEESRLIANVVKNEEFNLQGAMVDARTSYDRAWWTSLISAIVGVSLGVILAVAIVSRLNRTLTTSINSLRERSEDVSRIASQLASGADELASGATEQASSLEETSSALEQMASMTRQNADNAEQTKQTTSNTLDLITKGSQTVGGVIGAMREIDTSSEKISDIIKTIEEIAFQTNLLALNAAVEAARAGDAGKGFAVVADEVRSLAIRSSEAAKMTSELIQGSVEKVQTGSVQVKDLSESFDQIQSESRNVGRLVDEISSATREQALGVDQVNTAVAQMDKVTQSNAATAEESAAAANDLSEQSLSLNELVNGLARVVYGVDLRTKGVEKISQIKDGVTKIVQRRANKVIPIP